MAISPPMALVKQRSPVFFVGIDVAGERNLQHSWAPCVDLVANGPYQNRVKGQPREIQRNPGQGVSQIGAPCRQIAAVHGQRRLVLIATRINLEIGLNDGEVFYHYLGNFEIGHGRVDFENDFGRAGAEKRRRSWL